MTTASRERTKIYIVIGLSALFVAVGYSRFSPGRIVSADGTPRDAGATVRTEVPALALKVIPVAPTTPAGVFEPPRTMLRNIFAPLAKKPAPAQPPPAAPGKEPSAGGELTAVPEKAPSARTEPAAAPAEPPKPLPSLKLTGTITGGKRPLAFINGRSLGLGEKIEGLQVVSITRNQVALEGEGRNMLLNVLEISESGKP
jgi:hypothetical protein